MDLPTRSGDVLAQPTRARLFDLLGQLRRPAATDELAERLDLHRNGIRAHLERLREAGLVTRERTRQTRGRPRDMWSIAPDAAPGGEPPTAYADLGRWLARVVGRGRTGIRAAETTGREIGRDLAPDDGPCSAEEKMHAAIVSLGFRPRRERGDAGELTYRLCNCPYRDAVREQQDVVCALHRGMTQGLLDVLSPSTKLTGFVPHDPYAAGCLVQLRGELAGEVSTA